MIGAIVAVATAAMLGLPESVGAAVQPDVTLLDVIELDMGYTTLTDNYYRPVRPQALLDGARVGMMAYLRGRGIADPGVPLLRARPDGRGVVPAIEHELGKAISRYGSRVDARDFVHETIRGELGALHDPYSVFFTTAELRGFRTALDGESFGGIGVVLARDADGRYRVDTIFDGSPAARAGLAAGDRIVAVDTLALDGVAPSAAASSLRGRPGTVVRLAVERQGGEPPLHFTITRAEVVPPEVTSRLIAPGIAYLALRGFGSEAGTHVRSALVRLRGQGARATVLDLRGNGGGYEHAAVAVASVFIPDGTIVQTLANHGHRQTTSADGTALATQPLVVLVDGDSASGSELVTGAIADRGYGKVVGTRTFGKGLVQTMFPLPDGSAMKVTTARYFTPAGRDIDRIGITPDVVVSESAEALRGKPGQDPQLDAALRLLSSAP